MNYASGLMMGTALIQGFRQLFGGSSGFSAGGMGSGRGMGMGGMGGVSGLSDIGNIIGMSGKGRGGMRKNNGSEFKSDFNFKSMFFAAKHQMELVSSTPGRRRYRILNLTESQAEMLENALNRVEYINEVSSNHISGSLLIVYDEEKCELLNELIDAINNKVFKSQNNAPAANSTNYFPAPIEPSVGAITRSIKNTMLSFNEWVGKKSFGLLDAGSLAFILFLIRGLRKMILNQEYPNGSQMIWWAVSMLRGWRTI
ncbi:MAG: hypothetical protein IKN43_10175 [Selenomonadaceae bacterium]|nr:hypothetical protein [Selenomonadaceae bacterium]